MIPLSDNEFIRYDRQISIKGFDIEGQSCLKNASALIIGLGGLGCSAAQYLASAGIGSLTLVDFDRVLESNLHRQILHTEKHINELKVDSAESALIKINPKVNIKKIAKALNNEDLTSEVNAHSIVLDCSDNLPTRQQLNQICFKFKTPLVSAAAIRTEGFLTTFSYESDQPCYHCLCRLFGSNELSCVESGIMSPVVGIIGAMQAMETIKVLTSFGEPLIGKLLMVDAFTMTFKEIMFDKMPSCPVCSHLHYA